MGGRELLKMMAEQFPDIPKIVLTGYGTNDDIIVALKTGAYDFLTKPITDFTILEHSIDRALEKKRISDERDRYVEQLKQINEIISMLNRGKNTEDIFHTLNIILRRVIPFNRLALTTLNSDINMVTIKLVASDRDIFLREGDSFDVNNSPLRKSAKGKDVLNINNLNEYLQSHPESSCTELLIEEGMNSSLVLPLIVNNLTRGFLIFSSEQIDAFQESHITFLKSIVGQISLSIQRGELLYEIEQHSKNLEDLVELRSRQVIKTQKTTIFALSRLAETRDPETGNHLDRMRSYSVLLAQMLKYIGNHSEITNQYLRDLYDSSILHDIGKVGIPDVILLKDGFLSDNEFQIMKQHTSIGYESLKMASKDLGEDSFLNMALEITLYHHERWDGKGYPTALAGKEIPLSARIVAIADIYDALTSKRPYKEAYSSEKSFNIMKKEHYRFDPEIFEIFCDNYDEFNKIRTQLSDDINRN
jgi:response regulator RpfG family c-di-GMP phosphodiesterase